MSTSFPPAQAPVTEIALTLITSAKNDAELELAQKAISKATHLSPHEKQKLVGALADKLADLNRNRALLKDSIESMIRKASDSPPEPGQASKAA